jgi:hypothetical protein
MCEHLCQLKCNKTSSLEDSSPLQYSNEINLFHATKSSLSRSQKPAIFSTLNQVSPAKVLFLKDANQY